MIKQIYKDYEGSSCNCCHYPGRDIYCLVSDKKDMPIQAICLSCLQDALDEKNMIPEDF